MERADDGNGAWEVEVERGGGTLEVHLGSDLEQLGAASDDDGSGDRSESEDGD